MKKFQEPDISFGNVTLLLNDVHWSWPLFNTYIAIVNVIKSSAPEIILGRQTVTAELNFISHQHQDLK